MILHTSVHLLIRLQAMSISIRQFHFLISVHISELNCKRIYTPREYRFLTDTSISTGNRKGLMRDLPRWLDGLSDVPNVSDVSCEPASQSHHLETMFCALQTAMMRHDNEVNVTKISRFAFICVAKNNSKSKCASL